MRWAAVLVGFLGVSSCSFAFVHAPEGDVVTTRASAARCTTSDVLPALDALAGALAIATAAGGTIVEHTSDSGSPKNFDLYFAGPLLAVAIAYLWSASSGTTDVEDCNGIHEREIPSLVRPIPKDIPDAGVDGPLIILPVDAALPDAPPPADAAPIDPASAF